MKQDESNFSQESKTCPVDSGLEHPLENGEIIDNYNKVFGDR